MAGCGCKDDKPADNVIPAKLQDGEAVISEDLAKKYKQTIEDIQIKSSNSDLEAKIRMLESELQLWKDSYEELSNDYIALLGDDIPGEGSDYATPQEKQTGEIVLKIIADVAFDNDVTTCDVFDTFDVNIKPNDKISVNGVRFGVVSIGDQIIED